MWWPDLFGRTLLLPTFIALRFFSSQQFATIIDRQLFNIEDELCIWIRIETIAAKVIATRKAFYQREQRLILI